LAEKVNPPVYWITSMAIGILDSFKFGAIVNLTMDCSKQKACFMAPSRSIFAGSFWFMFYGFTTEEVGRKAMLSRKKV